MAALALALLLVPRLALTPNAIAFRSPARGVAGGGWTSCPSLGCRAGGTISLTDDGGRTWRVVLRTRRPVVDVTAAGGVDRAELEGGRWLSSRDGGRTWRPAAAPVEPRPPCPLRSAQVPGVERVIEGEWALCVGEPGAGNQPKAVYRRVRGRWKRIAWTNMLDRGPVGGISSYGYPLGMTMARDGFGIIWESRGTLYVTRDGGYRWHALPGVARPEIDFGVSAVALPHGMGYVVLALGGGTQRRLLETADAGRTWHVVRRWR
jgi:photosystem II stability/assembly factor-like uncharacterized protein